MYAKGTVYIRLSAADGEVHILEDDAVINGDCAVIEPKKFIPPYYLLCIIRMEFTSFYNRYVGSNINVQFDSLKYLRVNVHEDIETQYYYNNLFLTLEREKKEEERLIVALQKVKSSMLSKLFV
jgi:restriction endonuclease S subunit